MSKIKAQNILQVDVKRCIDLDAAGGDRVILFPSDEAKLAHF